VPAGILTPADRAAEQGGKPDTASARPVTLVHVGRDARRVDVVAGSPDGRLQRRLARGDVRIFP
jgi:hypothetical protein